MALSRRGVPLTAATVLLLLAGCGEMPVRDRGPAHPVDLSAVPEPVPRIEPRSRYGNPETYSVNGKSYTVLTESAGYVERGLASWYGLKFHGQYTSSREVYDMYAMTAAHKTLPLPTFARVTNLENQRSVIVRINDRGPFHDDRIIDLSYAAATRLGVVKNGTAMVEVRAIEPAEPAHAPRTSIVEISAQPGFRGDLPAEPPRLVAIPASAPPAAFYVQVGAFASLDNAERLRARVAAVERLSATVHQASGEGSARLLYRVRVGPLSSRQEADELVERLANLGAGTPRVVSEPPVAD